MENVSYTYPRSSTPALRGVSFEVRPTCRALQTVRHAGSSSRQEHPGRRGIARDIALTEGDPKWRRLDTLDAAPFIIAMLRFSCQPTGLLKRGTASGERATRLARSDDPAGFVVRRRPFVAMARLHGT